MRTESARIIKPIVIINIIKPGLLFQLANECKSSSIKLALVLANELVIVVGEVEEVVVMVASSRMYNLNSEAVKHLSPRHFPS